MHLREKKLQEYFINQLFPINFIEEDKKKRLSLSLNLFKICNNFPKDEIGKMKKVQKALESESVSNLLYSKSWKELNEEELIDVKKLLNKRATSPSRNSPYIKFIAKSFLKTYDSTLIIASFKEEIYEGWVFKKDGVKYDLTVNQDKINFNCIYLDPNLILDESCLIKKDFIFNLASIFFSNYNKEKVQEINSSLNKIIDNYNYLYNNKESVIDLNLKEEKLVFRR